MTERTHVTLEAGQLHIGRRAFAFSAIEGTRTERRDPKIARRMLGTLGAAVLIPAVLYLDAITDVDLSWLIAVPMTLAVGLFWSVMTAQTRYVLLLRQGRQEQVAFSSDRAADTAEVENEVQRCLSSR